MEKIERSQGQHDGSEQGHGQRHDHFVCCGHEHEARVHASYAAYNGWAGEERLREFNGGVVQKKVAS